MTKKETVMNSIEWKIEDEKETIENMKRNIVATIENFNERTAPEEIEHYARKMKEAADKLNVLYESKKQIEWLIEVEDNRG